MSLSDNNSFLSVISGFSPVTKYFIKKNTFPYPCVEAYTFAPPIVSNSATIIQLITTIVIVISTTAVTSNLGKTKVLKDLGKTAQEATEVVKGNTSDELGSSRMYIWKNALKIVPKYLFVGAGVDNFYYAFEGGPLLSKSGSVYFDKAHNEYLNTLITEGIFGLIIYLAFYFVTVKSGIKDSFKNNKICYILPIGRIFSTSIF